MATINFVVPDNQINRVLDAFEELFPVPTDEQGTPLFSQAQWARECIRNYIKSCVQRAETKVAREVAAAAISVPEDIVTDA